MDFLILIKNGCDNVTATAAPSLDSLGLHMVISLATIMLVWFGVQEALASAQGGPGFNVAKFISFFVLITPLPAPCCRTRPSAPCLALSRYLCRCWAPLRYLRSEERRVGQEGRSRWSPD